MSASRSAGNGCSTTSPRISAPASGQRAGVVGVEALETASAIRSARPSCGQEALVGRRPSWRTRRARRTPERRRGVATISPSEAFLPPTWSRSPRPRSANQRDVGAGAGAGVLRSGGAGAGHSGSFRRAAPWPRLNQRRRTRCEASRDDGHVAVELPFVVVVSRACTRASD